MIFLIIGIILIVLLFKTIFIDKVHIDFKSFFKRGFKKTDNQFRGPVLHAVSNGKREDILLHTLHHFAKTYV